MHRWLHGLLLVLLVGISSGCASRSSTGTGVVDDRNKPADADHLRLFNAQSRGDFLVVYDEYAEWNYAVRTRAYFVKQNERRILHDRAPHFVNPELATGLPAIPVTGHIPLAAKPTAALFAVATYNEPSFTIYSGSRELGSYQLPVYEDRKDVYEATASKAAQTTGEVVGCSALYVSYAALMALWGVALSGYSITVH